MPQCDRCFKTIYSKPHYIDIAQTKLYEWLHYEEHSYVLCDDCYKKLKEF